MLKLTNASGLAVFLHPDAIAYVLETGASSRWHNVYAIVRTFDGKTIEVREEPSHIQSLIEAQQKDPT